MAEDNAVSVKFSVQLDELTSGINSAKAKIEELTSPITKLTNAFSEIKEAIVVAFAVEAIVGFIEKISEAAEQTLKMSSVLGISAENASKFSLLMQEVGISATGALRPMELLSTSVATALSDNTTRQAKAFEALGISLSELKEHGNDAEGMLELLREAFNRFGDGLAKTDDFRIILGRGFDQLVPILRKTEDQVNELKEKIAETGAVMSAELQEKAETTGENMRLLGDAFVGVGNTIYGAFQPAIDVTINGLKDLVVEFNNSLKAGGLFNQVLAFLVVAVDSFIGFIEGLIIGLRQLWDVFDFVWRSMAITLVTFSKIMNDILSLDFTGALTDAGKGTEALKTLAVTNFDDIAKAGHRMTDDLKSLFSNIHLDENGLSVDTSGGKPGAPKPPKPQPSAVGKTGSNDEVAQWRATLQAMLVYQVGFYDDSKSYELKYWQDKLAITTAGSKQAIAVMGEIYRVEKGLAADWLQQYSAGLKQQETAAGTDISQKLKIVQGGMAELSAMHATGTKEYESLEQEKVRLDEENEKKIIDIAKQLQTQKTAIAKDDANTAISANKIKLSDDEATAQSDYTMHRTSLAQKYSAEQDYLNKSHALDMTSLAEEQSGMLAGTAAFEAIENKKFLSEQEFQAKSVALTRQTVQEEHQLWLGYANSIVSPIGNAFTQILTKQMTWRQAATSILQSWLSSFINIITQALAEWITNLAQQLIGTESTNTAMQASQTTFQSTSMIATRAYALAQGEAASDVAAAWAFADSAMAGPPGLAAAPGVAATTKAEVLALASFEVGAWNIPKNMAANLHAGEMVIPASFAEGMRNNDGGGVGGGGGNYNITVQAIDTRGAAQFLKTNARTIVDALQAQSRNGHSAFQGV